MAAVMDDADFGAQCRRWADAAWKSLDEVVWNRETGSYLMYGVPGGRMSSDTVFVAQLEGGYGAWLVGLRTPIPTERADESLAP